METQDAERSEHTRVARLIGACAALSVRRPRTTLAIALAVVAAALAFTGARLQLRTSNLDLIDPHLPEVRRFLDFAYTFGTPNVLVVVLEGKDPRAIEAAIARIGPPLRQVPGVRNVLDRLPLPDQTIRDLGLDAYARAEDGGLYCVFVQPGDPHSDAATIEPVVRGVRQVLADAQLGRDGVRAGLTGLPAYALDDRDVIQRDITRLSVASFVLIVGLFIVSFGSFRRPVLSMLSLACGIGLTMGFAALYPGHLTLLSAFFVTILFGLCDDLGIQTVSRLEELVAAGMPEHEAIPRALQSLARGMVTGTLTTAAAFFSVMFSGFRGFAELGAIAGAGALLCLVTTVTVLPALLTLFRTSRPRASIHADRVYGRLMEMAQHRPLAIAVGVAGLAAAFIGGPGFDTDYLNLEPAGSEAVRLEREMVKRTDLSPQFAVFVVDSAAKAKSLADRLLAEDCCGDVRSIADLDALAAAPGGAPDLPASYRAALVSTSGQYAVYAYPQGDVWNPRQQAEFLSRMRALDPNVTGMPVLGQFMVEQSQRGMRLASLLASLALLASVALDFRRVLPTALAALPTVLALLSLRALMRLFHVQFNPLNVMAIPVIIGLAVNFGVHLVHRFVEEGGDIHRTLQGTGRSVLLSALTTLVGFGTLMFTEHRGLASFAKVMTLGLASALAFSVILLPALLARARAGLLRSGSG